MLEAPLIPTTLARAQTLDTCDPEVLLLECRSTPILSEYSSPLQVHRPRICGRTHSILTHLHLPGLLRSGRLRADIRTLSAIPDHQIDDQLDNILAEGPLLDFVIHVQSAIEQNPHVLVAYAWVFYMAIFSGGRFLRAELSTAGPDFWAGIPIDNSASVSQPSHLPSNSAQVRSANRSDSLEPRRHTIRSSAHSESCVAHLPPVLGLSFFHFFGDEDGEDIKREFKKRLLETEVLLTLSEREDILREAQAIFDRMIVLVGALDDACGTTEEDVETAKGRGVFVGGRTGNSLFVAQERKRRAVDKSREIAGDQTGQSRRSNFFEILFMAPLGRVVRFSDALPSIWPRTWSREIGDMRTPLGRKFSTVGTTGLDTKDISRGLNHELESSRETVPMTLGSLSAIASLVTLLSAIAVWWFKDV